jgi:predicted nucleic-acid-binding protein
VLISLLVLLETEWVLCIRSGLPKTAIIDAICGLLDATELEFEDEPAAEEAIYAWKDSAADFPDCLIGAHHRRLGCRAAATFDVKAVRLPGFVAG